MATEVKLIFTLDEDVTPELFATKVEHMLRMTGTLRDGEALRVAPDQFNQCERIVAGKDCPLEGTETVIAQPTPCSICGWEVKSA